MYSILFRHPALAELRTTAHQQLAQASDTLLQDSFIALTVLLPGCRVFKLYATRSNTHYIMHPALTSFSQLTSLHWCHTKVHSGDSPLSGTPHRRTYLITTLPFDQSLRCADALLIPTAAYIDMLCVSLCDCLSGTG